MVSPLVQFIDVKPAGPSLRDNTGDLDRLKRALLPHLAGRVPAVPFTRMAVVARAFREACFQGAAVVNDLESGPELVDFLPGLPSKPAAMALDLGTTHLEAVLVDLRNGDVLAKADRENSQIRYGADILSRIHFAEKDDGLAVLHNQIIDCVNDLAARLARKTGISTCDIRALSVSGNTCMVHFFLRLNPHHLCREPYIPVVNAPDPPKSEDLGLDLHPGAPVWVLPSVGSYFGGDLISGILDSGIDKQEETAMLIDVGTNAEVVLGNRDWLIACAGAAGPALEGGVARMGMRAGPGAIEHINIDPGTGALSYTTIKGRLPQGICGSGLIDLVAGLYLARIIDVRGKFRMDCGSERLIRSKNGPVFVVVPAGESSDGEAITIGQVDLDALMRSKAAMYAILTTIINQVQISFDDLESIYIAGAFGRHIAPRPAIILGMLPDLPLKTYKPLGNSSLAGAQKILLDREVRERSLKVVKKITYVELNVNYEFMLRFSGSKFIPHTDHALFPSVPFFNNS